MHIFLATVFALTLSSYISAGEQAPTKPPRLSRSELLGCSGAINVNEFDHDAMQGSVDQSFELDASKSPRNNDPMDVDEQAVDTPKDVRIAEINKLLAELQQLTTETK